MDFHAELKALEGILDALEPLSPDGRARVLLHVALVMCPDIGDELLERLVQLGKNPNLNAAVTRG